MDINQIALQRVPEFEETARRFREIHQRPMATYIAGKFSGDVENNIKAAVEWGVWANSKGAFPVIPHSNTSDPRFEKQQPYEFWITATSWLLTKCDAVLFIPGWSQSDGAIQEYFLAELFIPKNLVFLTEIPLTLPEKFIFRVAIQPTLLSE